MKIIAAGLAVTFASVAVSACSAFSGQTYCLAEQEANGLDYMVVTDNSFCDNPNSDAEWHTTDEHFNYGDTVYVEADGDHSTKRNRKHEEIKRITTPPPYVPATKAPVICNRANYKPAPKPAPDNKTVKPAAPAQTPNNATPVQTPPKVSAPVAVATNKPGC